MRVEEANRIWASIERRAEKAEGAGALANLVELDDVNPIFDPASMVVFGRRGAGKTHTLLHLRRKVEDLEDVGVYVDMRKISSNAGIYDDDEIAFGTRATNMLVDVIGEVHEELYRLAVLGESELLSANLHRFGPALDKLAEAVTKVRVVGETTLQIETRSRTRDESSSGAEIEAGKTLGARAHSSRKSGRDAEFGTTETRSGRPKIYVHLGELDAALSAIVQALDGHKLWLLIDEWSAGVPYELQPVLADMLRRTFVSTPGIIVKIAAIEHRAKFITSADNVEYVGLELGSDTAETLSLDSRLVIGTNPRPAQTFIRHLLAEHFRSAAGQLAVEDVADPVALSFHANAFPLLVLASEGNPRDAINLVSKAARKARAEKVSADDVLSTAEDYFWNTKYKNVEGDRPLERMFEEFVNTSLERGLRTILFERSDKRRPLVDKLNDRRLIHLLRSGLRARNGGSLYDLYAVDFGSYAERIRLGQMRWENDGFANPMRFHLGDDTESWRQAVIRRRSS
ncbi:hypothetical protein [Aeromicrobium sp. HA]|uniref:hypothetical protein n=1 Tax=Aeromicrobium sp. HA TaxID=3009077 RepID=UPI0022AE556F|nr:hypothetical protein [Aeromicrobium sp. HA]